MHSRRVSHGRALCKLRAAVCTTVLTLLVFLLPNTAPLVPPLLLRSCLLQIIIPAQNLTSALSEVKGRHLWGTDIYTDDSDLLCALMHCGYYNATLKKPVSSIAEMNVIIQLMPPQQTYPNYTRNGIRPRAWWVGGTTCSYKVSLRLTGRKEKSIQWGISTMPWHA